MPTNDTAEFINQLLQQNASLTIQVRDLTAQVTALMAQVAELTQTIRELQEQKNKNSKNSSKPPSSDGLKKQAKNNSLRESSGKKQGAQPGHDGTHMEVVGEPDEIHTMIPEACRNCSHWKKCKGQACIGEKRYKVDVTITQTLDEYDSLQIQCPKMNQLLKGKFPAEIKGQIQYGENIASLIVALNTVGSVSAKRT